MASQQCCVDALYIHKHATFPLGIFYKLLRGYGGHDDGVAKRMHQRAVEERVVWAIHLPIQTCVLFRVTAFLTGLHAVYRSSTVQPMWE